jgi:hypothetical protein
MVLLHLTTPLTTMPKITFNFELSRLLCRPHHLHLCLHLCPVIIGFWCVYILKSLGVSDLLAYMILHYRQNVCPAIPSAGLTGWLTLA